MKESHARVAQPGSETHQAGAPDLRHYLAQRPELSLAEILELLAADQVHRWQEGQRVPAETYLTLHPALAGSCDQAFELIFEEFVLRDDRGENPSLEEFLWRFPHFAVRLKRQYDLHTALREGRGVSGSNPSHATPRGSHWPAVSGYEITGELGRGGMGVVYRARHLQLNRPTALKMILEGFLASPDAHGRFLSEARAAAALHHPNIVQVHDIDERNGRPFLAMELIEGGNLAERIGGTPQSSAAAARLVEILARAVAYAHRQGVVHRDLKPTNVLIAEGSGTSLDACTPKITDFGLAKQLAASSPAGKPSTGSGAILGTAEYMAPEQASSNRKKVGPATDVHALGAILYELLTARPPFNGVNFAQTLFQVIYEDAVPPGRLEPVPRDLETICLKCLEKNPRQRYATAEALADDLQRFQDGKPVHARPVGFVERAWRWCRRKPALAISLALLATVVMSAFVALDSAYHQAETALSKAVDRDQRTRRILAEFIRPNGFSSFQPVEANRRLNLARLKLAAEHYEALVREQPDDPALQAALANVYMGASLLQYESWQLANALAFSDKLLPLWGPTRAETYWLSWNDPARTAAFYLGSDGMPPLNPEKAADALVFNDKALRLWRRLTEARPHEVEYRASLAEANYFNGLLERDRGYFDRALESLQCGAAMWEALANQQPTADHRYSLARAQRPLCEVLYNSGRTAEALRLMAASQAILIQLTADRPDDRRSISHLARNYSWLGIVHAERGFQSEAFPYHLRAYELVKEWFKQHPAEAGAAETIAHYASPLIGANTIEPYYSEAVGPYEKSSKSIARLVEEEPTDRTIRRHLETCYINLMQIHEKAGKLIPKLQAWERYVQFLEDLSHQVPEEAFGFPPPSAYGDLAICYREADDPQKTARAARQGLNAWEHLRLKQGARSAASARRFQCANEAWLLAHGVRRAGLTAANALYLAEQSRDLLLDLFRESPQNTRYAYALFHAYEEIGKAHVTLGRNEEALLAWLDAVTVMRRVLELAPSPLAYRIALSNRCSNISRHLCQHGRLAEAAHWLLEREKLLPADPLYTQQLSREFSSLAAMVGRGRKALSSAERAEKDRFLRLSARPDTEIQFWIPARGAANP